MKTLYILAILAAFSHGSRGVVFPTSQPPCDNKPDFCQCLRTSIICDCQSENKTTTGDFFRDKTGITIRNCHHLTVPQGSFKSGRLKVIFQDIQNLSLAANSFQTGSNGRINVTISNSSLDEIPSGLFTMRDPTQPSSIPTATNRPNLVLQISASKIGRIASGVFASFILQELTIANSIINRMDTKAINNQVRESTSFINNTFVSLGRQAVVLHSSRSDSLVLDGNKFKGNVTQFLEGSIGGDVKISNNIFPKLEVSPWKLTVVRDITLKNNTFPFLPRYGMNLTVGYRITFLENDIHHLGPQAFLHILPEGRNTIIFMDRNLIHRLEPMSLCLNEAFSPNSIVIKHVRFQQECACNITKTLLDALNMSNLEAIHSNDVHKQWFNNGECKLKRHGIGHISIDQFIRSCLKHSHYMEILVSLAVVLIIIAVCVILGWRRMRNRAANANTSAAGYHSYTEPYPSNTVPGSWLVVQPEARTYQETEIHVLFDKAEEITDGNDAEAKDEVPKDMKNLKRTPSPLTRQSCPVLK